MNERYGLIGKNIQYSKSPKIHQHMAKKLGRSFTYELFDIDESDVSYVVKMLRHGQLQGLNVTIPYKQSIMNFVDVLTPKAMRIKAVNTLYVKNGQVIGDNTDYDGFIGLLTKQKIDVKHKKVYILGAGGAAKAAYCVLTDLGAHPIVVSRQKDDVDPYFLDVISYQELQLKPDDICINTTPMGTYPKVSESVLDKKTVEQSIVIDLIYNPLQTTLMSYAKKGYNGLWMLILQAIKSEEIWFDRKIECNEKLYEELKDVIYT